MAAVRNRRAFSAGLLFVIVAALFLVLSRGLERGTIARMGPGFFPWMLSLALGLVGLAVMIGAMRPGAAVAALPRWDWRALGWIVGATCLFALLLEPLGLVAALAVLAMTAARASLDFTWKGGLGTAAVLIALSVVLFDWLIDLRLPLWPGGPG
jgi:hypothetical protein